MVINGWRHFWLSRLGVLLASSRMLPDNLLFTGQPMVLVGPKRCVVPSVGKLALYKGKFYSPEYDRLSESGFAFNECQELTSLVRMGCAWTGEAACSVSWQRTLG